MALPTKAKANGAIGKAEDYANRIVARLDQILERIEYQTTKDQLLYVRGNADALGADLFMEFTPPLGTLWFVERIFVSGNINTQVEMFLDDTAPSNRVEAFGIDALGIGRTEPADCRVYVPGGRKLIVHFSGQVAGQLCSVNLRVREFITEE